MKIKRKAEGMGMDLKQWIYSPDIARWLSDGRELDLMEQSD